MRIGMITGEYPPQQGGVGAFTDRLSQALTEQGHVVHIFSNVRTVQQHQHIMLHNKLKKWHLFSHRLVQAWADTHRLELVNLQLQTAAFDMSPWVYFFPDRMAIPFVTTFHDLRVPYLFPKAGTLRNWIVKHLAKASEGVIVTNDADFSQIQAQTQRCAVIPIGSNIASNSSIRQSQQSNDDRVHYGLASTDFVIAHFGFVNHSKGIDTLLKAVAQLDDVSIQVLMIGGRTGASDTSNQAYVRIIDQLIDDLHLQAQVHWTGYLSDEQVDACLTLADIVVLPYRDGASLRRGSLLAAIQAGCAIISTQPQVAIPLFDAGHMLFVTPDHAEQLAQAIHRLQHNPIQRQTLQARVTELRQHFGWDTIAQRSAVFYETVLEQCL